MLFQREVNSEKDFSKIQLHMQDKSVMYKARDHGINPNYWIFFSSHF